MNCPCHKSTEKNYLEINREPSLKFDDAPTTDTSDWEKDFEKIYGDPKDFPPLAKWKPILKSFIAKEIERAREEGYREGQDWNSAYGAGRTSALAEVREKISKLSDEVRLYSTDVQPIFAKVVFVKRLNAALQDILDQLK